MAQLSCKIQCIQMYSVDCIYDPLVCLATAWCSMLYAAYARKSACCRPSPPRRGVPWKSSGAGWGPGRPHPQVCWSLVVLKLLPAALDSIWTCKLVENEWKWFVLTELGESRLELRMDSLWCVLTVASLATNIYYINIIYIHYICDDTCVELELAKIWEILCTRMIRRMILQWNWDGSGHHESLQR